ncbi:MAG: aldose epimerase family protein [Fervidobacterium sp.]
MVEGYIKKKEFGFTEEGILIHEYTLINKKGLTMKVLTYGGIIRELWVPSKSGNFIDVVLGYDTLEEYERNPGYLGTIVGRYANRIAYGRFEIDGISYQLALNDKDRPNTLHGGYKGFNKKVWKAFAEVTPNGPMIILKYFSHDGEEGFPGNLDCTVIYTLTNDNEIKIEYIAKTDKPTIVNLTQHTYFNLAGGGKIYNHVILINADMYTPVNEYLIPTGEILPVNDSVYDLRKERKIGELLEKMKDSPTKGFDNNFVLNSNFAAKVYEVSTGITLELFTTQPGLQFYTGNYLPGMRGKRGQYYEAHTGFCLETQHFPDSPNHSNFPNTVLRPKEVYKHQSVFKFGNLK